MARAKYISMGDALQ